MKLCCLILCGFTVVAGVGAPFILYQGSDPGSAPESKTFNCTPDRVIANGVTEGASLEVSLRPEIIGRITKVHVRGNEEVKAGDVLVELDNAVPKHQVALALAEVARARAALEKVRAGERKEKRQAVAAVEEAARLEYNHAKKNFERTEKLYDTTSLSRSDYDKHQFQMLEAEAKWQQARAELDLVQAPARPEDVALAEADVAAADARWQQAKAEVDKTILKAPFAGRVLRVYAEPGEMVAPNQVNPILVFADMSKIRVRAFVEELDCARVKVGQTATLTSDALPNTKYTGKIVQVLSRMGKQAPQSNRPGEYSDVYFREVLIELNTREELPIHLRVEVQIHIPSTPSDSASQELASTK